MWLFGCVRNTMIIGCHWRSAPCKILLRVRTMMKIVKNHPTTCEEVIIDLKAVRTPVSIVRHHQHPAKTIPFILAMFCKWGLVTNCCFVSKSLENKSKTLNLGILWKYFPQTNKAAITGAAWWWLPSYDWIISVQSRK